MAEIVTPSGRQAIFEFKLFFIIDIPEDTPHFELIFLKDKSKMFFY